jgi:hypothetical protein
MTLANSVMKQKVIIDFGNEIYSKEQIKGVLASCPIIRIQQIGAKDFIIYSNIIKIGTFQIALILPLDAAPGWHLLSEYGDFMMYVYDPFCVDLDQDSRFKDQTWVSKNCFGKLRVKHLVNAIYFCMRLSALKAFS